MIVSSPPRFARLLHSSEEMSQLVSAAPFCDNEMRVLRTKCDGTVHLQAVDIEEVQKLVQKDNEWLIAYCKRGRSLMSKMGVLRYMDKDRRMVSALVRGLWQEMRVSVAS